ncbi:MAG: TonB-dependent receptor [Bacteroidales bacterium]|nr:TonB-dependent receptor [Bacteroidales bacterium]
MKKTSPFLLSGPESWLVKPGRIFKFWAFLFSLVFFGLFRFDAVAQDSYTPLLAGSFAIDGNSGGHDGAGLIYSQRRITGTVRDELGDPLVGATVQVVGTVTGALTDADGRFTLDIPNENAMVMVSFVGYITQQVAVAGKTTIDVVLSSTLTSIDEVVVVGYGTQRRTTMTGSVSVVKGDEVSKVPVSNITNAMAGKLAGVLTRQSGGQPGADNAEIFVRGVATTGSGAPLVVIDGIIRSRSEYNGGLGRYVLVSNLNQLDPSTIESVTVLKDAAAVAPYGMAAANGVILITTKKGQEGLPTLTFNTYYGVQQPTYYPDLLNAVDYMKLRNEATLNGNPDAVLPFDPEVINNYASLNASDPDRYPSSNTRDLVNLSIPIQKYDISISGGSQKMKYFAGAGYYGQKGLFEKVNYNRFNVNLNLDANVTNTTKMSLSIIGSHERTNDLDVASSASQLFRNGYKFIPTEAIYYSNGLWGQFAGNSPVAVLKGDGYEHVDANTIMTAISVEQQLSFIKGLSIKGTFSYDTKLDYQKGWHTPFYYYAINLNDTPYSFARQISTQEGGVPAYTYLAQQDSRRRNYTYQGYINYARAFGQHEVTGLVVAEARNNDYDYLYARRNNFAVGIDELSLGSSSKNDYDNGGSSSVGAQMGYVYRVGWNYANKYLAEASGRYDGHYYFAPGKRWGYFPAFSLGWRISEESFMQGLQWLDNLKLRASWGKSGNLAGGPYQYLSGYTLAGNGYAFGSGTMVQEAYVTTENNPNITWEISQKSDVGFEASLWESLLLIEADLFYEKRSGMLLSPAITVPYEYGLNLAQENSGKMDNYGFELQLGTRRSLQSGLDFNVMANLSIAKNKMVETFETAATYDNPNRRRTGRPYGTVFGYQALGLFSLSDDKNSDGIIDAEDGYNIAQWGTLHPGDIKYEDISGPEGTPDGKIDSNDEVVIGYPTYYPLMTFGINANASYKGFDVSLFFQGSGMTSYAFNGNFQVIPFNNNNSNAAYEYYNNHWSKDNPDGKYPIANANPVANNTQASTFWQWNTSYLRLKNAQLGYTLPASVMRTLKIQSIRVYVASQNALTFSKLKFVDPEAVTDVGYPNMRTFTVGANVTF